MAKQRKVPARSEGPQPGLRVKEIKRLSEKGYSAKPELSSFMAQPELQKKRAQESRSLHPSTLKPFNPLTENACVFLDLALNLDFLETFNHVADFDVVEVLDVQTTVHALLDFFGVVFKALE